MHANGEDRDRVADEVTEKHKISFALVCFLTEELDIMLIIQIQQISIACFNHYLNEVKAKS